MEQDPEQGNAGAVAAPPAERGADGRFPPGVSGNPRGRQKREIRADAYVNAFLGHNTSRDRRSFTKHTTVPMTDLQAIDLRRGNWLAARICELLPDEGFRRAYELKLPKKKTAEKVQTAIEVLRLNAKVKEAAQMERTAGGAAIYPVLDGAAGDSEEPLDLENGSHGITKVLALHILEPRELVPETYYQDIANPKFRMPETYRLWPLSGGRGFSKTTLVHESRLAIFPGQRVTVEPLPGQRFGWGDSCLVRPAEVLSDFGLSWGSAATILHNFSQRVIKYKGLTEILKMDGGEALVQRRAQLMDMMASVLRALPLDSEDEFVTTSVSVAGLSDLLVQFAQLISAAADMPLTRLFGMSPAGLNATGENDVRGWYDRVGNKQQDWTPLVEWLIRLLLLSTDGPTGGLEPDQWSIEWRPLWTPSEKEEAERRKLVSETDKNYFDMKVLSSDDIANSRYGGDTYSAETTIDWKAREAQAKLDEQNAAHADAAVVAALGGAPANAPTRIASVRQQSPKVA